MTTLPITAFYAGLFALWFLFLSARTSLGRQKAQVGLGTNGDDDLLKRVRTHANAAEFLPLAFLLMLLLEMNTAWVWPLHAIGIALLLGRLLHAWGLSRSTDVSVGRFFGTLLTWLSIAVMALANIAFGAAWFF